MRMQDRVSFGDVEKTAEGYLTAFARTARTGIQIYAGSEVGRPEMDVVRVFRDEAVVFDKETIRRFDVMPITIGHPKGGVSAENYQDEAVGATTGDIMRDGEYMRVGLKIMASRAVQSVQDGKKQLSWGYDADLEWGEGLTPDGQTFDARQVNIRPNHIAIVDAARAGPLAAIGDSGTGQGQAWGVAPITSDDQKEAKPMANRSVTVDGFTFEANDQAAQAIDKLSVQVDGLKATITARDGELADERRAHEETRGKLAAAEKKAMDAAITPEKLADMVKERATVTDRYKVITGKDAATAATTADLMAEAVRKHLGDAAPAEMSAEYVKGVFDAIPTVRAGQVDPLVTVVTAGVQAGDAATRMTDTAALFRGAGVPMKKEPA